MFLGSIWESTTWLCMDYIHIVNNSNSVPLVEALLACHNDNSQNF